MTEQPKCDKCGSDVFGPYIAEYFSPCHGRWLEHKGWHCVHCGKVRPVKEVAARPEKPAHASSEKPVTTDRVALGPHPDQPVTLLTAEQAATKPGDIVRPPKAAE